MKNLILGMIATLAVVPVAFAQDGPSAKSYQVTVDNTGFGLTYLNDGYNGYAGITGKLTQVAPRLAWDALLVKPVREADQDQTWFGTALRYNAVTSDKVSFDVLLGYKGLDLSKSFDRVSLNKDSVVWGFSVGYKF